MATALPPRTAANDKLIGETPYDQLTDRQKQYAALYGVTLQAAPSAPPPPNLSQMQGFDSIGAANGLGFGLTTTPTDNVNNSQYVIDGKTYYVNGQQQQVVGGAGFNGANQTILAILSDPNMNAAAKQQALDSYASGGFTGYNTTRRPGDPIFGDGSGGTFGGAVAGASGSVDTSGKTAEQIAKDNNNKDAFASLKDTLGQYGLGNLADFAWQEVVNGRSATEILQDIRDTPEFDARFPAIKQRQQAGLPALSPGDYVSYEKNATEYMRAAGLPKGFYDDPTDFTKFLANDVSLNELGQRIDLAKQAAYQAPPEVRQALRGQFGLGDGDLAAFFLDPDRATPLLQRTYNAANIAGAATRTGYGVSADQDYRLADLGVSAQQAQGGFAQLGHDRELFNPLVGHANEGAITTDTQLAAQFGGNSQAQDMIEKRRRDRLAEFQDGGQFATGQQGISGLGSAGDR